MAIEARKWWNTPLIAALGGQRLMDLYVFKATLGLTRLNPSTRETEPSSSGSNFNPSTREGGDGKRCGWAERGI